MELKKASLDTPIPVFYVGKDLTEGPLPAVIYFALSAEESLVTPPYNKPVPLLVDMPARVFSVDLPFHGEGLPAVDAMKKWAESIEKGEDLIGEFLSDLKKTLTALFALDCIDSKKIAVAGLSRGGFIASHIAAAFPEIKTVVAYAPLTKIKKIKEFRSIADSPLVKKVCLDDLTDSLSTKSIKVFIGGRDVRVGTDYCYRWIHSLIETAYIKNIKTAPIELVIKPSIGHSGHGTSKASFKEGALFLMEKLQSE